MSFRNSRQRMECGEFSTLWMDAVDWYALSRHNVFPQGQNH